MTEALNTGDPRDTTCPTCHGTGMVMGPNPLGDDPHYECDTCHGTGITQSQQAGAPTPHDFRRAYERLRKAKENLFRAKSETVRLHALLKKREAEATAAGLDGSNEAARKANLALMFTDLRNDLLTAEADTNDFEFEADIAALECEALRWQVRAVLAAREDYEAARADQQALPRGPRRSVTAASSAKYAPAAGTTATTSQDAKSGPWTRP